MGAPRGFGGTVLRVASWDTSRYLTLFVGEATEHLDALSKDLIRLEQGASTEIIDSMFRHAHSVKGMAASMTFEATSKIAHQLEDLLSALRADMTLFDRGVGDLVLQAVDVLSAHVKAAAASQPFPDGSALVAVLAETNSKFPRPQPSAPTAPPPPASAPTGGAPATHLENSGDDVPMHPRFQIALRVSPAATQPGVRGFLAYKRLSVIGNVFDLKPPLEDVKAGRLEQGAIRLELETTENEAVVARTLKTVADVELVSIAAVRRASTPPVAPPASAPSADAARVIGKEPARTVRVKTELLDQFLDATGELLLATARVREVGKSLPEVNRPALDESVDRLHALVRDLHGKVMQARMTPLAVITDRLPRAARDIARRRAREVELTITGADIELDRAIVDELADPVLHLLRNAVDHGLEPPEERRMRGKPTRGTVTFTVRRLRDRVSVEVEDDGRGMDADRLKTAAVERGLLTPDQAKVLTEKEALMLCCLPGVSTASDVSDISGRGVGMDAVKRVVESVGGSLEIESQRGVGTKFRLTLPLTVAMVNLLLVAVGDDVFGLPIGKVSGVVELVRAKLERSQNAPVLHFGPHVIPVHELAEVLEVPGTPIDQLRLSPFVIIETDDGRLALGVDRLLGQQEVVLKALTKPLDLLAGLAGVTILGNGRPIFVLDAARLVTP